MLLVGGGFSLERFTRSACGYFTWILTTSETGA